MTDSQSIEELQRELRKMKVELEDRNRLIQELKGDINKVMPSPPFAGKTLPPQPACGVCGHFVAGIVNDRGWCIFCGREYVLRGRRTEPGIPVAG